MRGGTDKLKRVFKRCFGITIISFFAFAVNSSAQCLTAEESKKIIESFNSPAPLIASESKKLRKELLAMREERDKLNEKISENVEKNQKLIPEANRTGERHLLRICQIIRENGWLTKDVLKDDGFQAFTFLITTNVAFGLQRELLPVLSEAAKKGYIGNPILASIVDSIRTGLMSPQIFGTQATIRNNVIYLYPLLNEEKVDDWRKLYDLPPLAVQIRAMENHYALPLLKMHRPRQLPKLNRKKDEKKSDVSVPGISDNEENDGELLKIDTRLVNLNVRLLAQDLKAPTNVELSKEDFAVAEDGVDQEIVFFSETEQPFDLVLLLDFSGSTIEKRGLIKKAAQRFVEAARPIDRIAVVVFADEIKIVAELTTDRDALAQKIKDVELTGGSPIWDSLEFTYEDIIKKQSRASGRRSAIVFMTDAEDYSKKNTFADAMETVRRGDTTVFPIYLDNDRPFDGWSEKYRRKSRQALRMLAEESGGQYYEAGDAKDLNGIYEQIAGELGKVYSIGYEPKNEIRDGGWRNLTVKIKTRSDLIPRTRRGYYAN
jgi:VWFA-related protein